MAALIPSLRTWVEVTLAEPLRIGLRTMIGRAYPRIFTAAREPEWVFYGVALPLFRVIAFVLVYQALTFLIGRSIPRLFAAFLAFVITLGFGIVLLRVPVQPLQVNYPLLLFTMVMGMIPIVALGIALAGLSLMWKRGAWVMPDSMVGALYLLAGAIFPIAILPNWLEKVALTLPLTYWLELMRRALLGKALGAVFPIADTWMIMGLLVFTTLVNVLICGVIFRIGEYYARERGLIDQTTGY